MLMNVLNSEQILSSSHIVQYCYLCVLRTTVLAVLRFVSFKKVRLSLFCFYRERRNAALTLYDNEQVINTLSGILGAIMHLVATFAYAAIFGFQIKPILISLSSMALAFVFIFGNTVKTIYESLVFLFMIRPYQVGDCIQYKGDMHWVKNFGLPTTQFRRFDGCRVWV
jgi:small-conductance mechanosensitive channel